MEPYTMKNKLTTILFLSSDSGPDYQCDALYHGLCELPDVVVSTNADLWYMFEGCDEKRLRSLYGKGFSLYNRLKGSNKRVEKQQVIREKINAKQYDYIIYGSIHRSELFLNEVLELYPPERVAFVDGEDWDFSPPVKNYYQRKHFIRFSNQYRKAKILSRAGYYFKRELRSGDHKFFYPIYFAIPEQNVITAPLADKIREQAFIIPGDMSTYIYENEEDYYKGYAISKYGVTTKKAGWDCLRHYEILANGCIPYFPGIEKCPQYTMHLFPKNIIQETNKLIEMKMLSDSLVNYYCNTLLSYTKEHLTTKALARYVLAVMGCQAAEE